MNATDVKEAKLSPDGSAAVIATESPDWQHNRFRSDLWIWKAKTGATVPLTRSGHARSPQWSPDGRYIAFLSDLPLPEDKESDDVPERLWLISADSGESFPLYKEKLEAHAFAWSADGSQIFFSCPRPFEERRRSRKTQWKDVIRWREHERGDVLLAMPTANGSSAKELAAPSHADPDSVSPLPPLSRTIVTVTMRSRRLSPILKARRSRGSPIPSLIVSKIRSTMRSTW